MGTRYADKDMISVEEAREIVMNMVSVMPVERVELLASLERILAQDVASDIDITSFEHSAMDGFALRYEDVRDACAANPVCLRIVGRIGAGAVFTDTVLQGEAVRIMTGAPLPHGADTVVKIENTEVIGEGSDTPEGTEVRISKAPQRGENIRPSGEEAKAGEVLMRPGNCITFAGVGLLAATGTTQVSVYSRPRVAVFSTGSELVDASEVPGFGQIRNSNSPALAAAARNAGALVTHLPRVEDSHEALRAAVQEAVRGHDFVILSGGAADGDFDYTTAVIRELGDVLFSRVMMRPGKAQIFGLINGVPVFGLAGNPAAALVGFEILIRPALRKMQGYPDMSRPVATARLTTDVKKKEPRRFYLRARLERDEQGELVVTPAHNQSSGLFSTLYESNCLLIVPEGDTPLFQGDYAQCVCINLPEGEVI